MCCSDVCTMYTWNDCKTIGDLTASVFKVKWPLAGPCHYVSAILIELSLTKAIRGKLQFMWPFCPLPFFYACFPGLPSMQEQPCYRFPAHSPVPPPRPSKSNMRSPVWCLYFCPTLHWLHESIWIFPLDLWSCACTSSRFYGVTLRKNGWQGLWNVGSTTCIWHGFNNRKCYYHTKICIRRLAQHYRITLKVIYCCSYII